MQENNLLKDVGVIPYYSSPHDKRSAAHAENAVKIIEMRAKCIMMERMLPLEYWEEAVDAAIYISNVVALARDVKSTDGDAPRPIERISFGRVSRRQCDHMILCRFLCSILPFVFLR